MGWPIPAYLTALQTALQANATLAALDPAPGVLTHWPTPDQSTSDMILLYASRGPREAAVFSPERDDDASLIIGQVEVVRPGSGETVARQARERAGAIFDQVIYEVAHRPPAGTQTTRSKVVNHDMDQLAGLVGDPGTGVRVCVIRFEIQVRIRV